MSVKFTNYGVYVCAVDRWIMESTQTAASAVSFSLGERFRSFGELEDKLKRYEESIFTKFWKRDCRTVEAARRRMDRPLADCITYYAVADLGGVRGVQMHPPLAASNVFCVHNCTSPSNDYAAVACSNNNQAQLHTHVSVPY